ncbi:hypothetical protein OG204_06210 [Streptomyces sp. NBC_01387]|uniref:hypothetical protein n=1 Tax=unclassified Streptomyces TaxID=2593676 RepID=UPI0020252596|nr:MULTISPECIES: hypothetical protein [unclassified Streptomyces]MCX4552118.1 hypothetical protein [Streptomyces sp. NBC_01500]WSC23460.1 hypothetical protein OIE60_29415 [Streptomyces sp. NBC_01766]WSV57370.1 hypothetical protein OG282_28840 [Streptomyces sp. NBC_01014]
MQDRSLEALGLAVVPAKEPLSYPGLPIPEPSLLDGRTLLGLAPGPGPVETWNVAARSGPVPLDTYLSGQGLPLLRERHPAVSVGSNASPAQLSNKLLSRGISGTVPMVPVRIEGIAIGCCAHIYPAGYVATAPYIDRDSVLSLVVTWLDDDQMAAVDETELPYYQRVLLPSGDFPAELPNGLPVADVHLYASAMGVLAGPDGQPRPAPPEQAALLAELLAASPRLHELLGPDPQTWVDRASKDPELADEGTRLFRTEGWVVMLDDFLPYAQAHA